MGFGDNTRASLITRGLAETARLGVALGADPLTFAGLAGLGDLVATCSSPLARNRTFGEHLGRGETPGAGAGGHPADRRGRQELPGDPRPGPGARGRDADHRAGRAGLPRGRGPAGRGQAADGPGDEAGVSRLGDGTRAVHAGLPEPVAGRAVPARAGVRRAVPPRPGRRAGRATATAAPTTRPGARWRRRSASSRAAARWSSPAAGGDHRRCCCRCCAPATRWCCRPTATSRSGRSPRARCADLGVDVDLGADRRAVPRLRRAYGWCCWRPRPTRAWTCATSRPWPPRRTRPARWSRWTTPPPPRSGRTRWRSAPTWWSPPAPRR